MKKVLFGCCLLMLTVSCGEGKKKTTSFETSTGQIDSLNISPDTVRMEDLLEEELIPATADESFIDFFYNFASDEHFQRTRIVFPLSFYEENQVSRTERDDWTFDPMFSTYNAYTILFDTEEDMEIEKDTAVHSVQIDWICLKTQQVKRYYFERINARWFLEAINSEHIAHDNAGDEEDFITFYERFANDSVFQQERLSKPLTFVTADPEDEFQILETTLDEGQWFAFRPPMMRHWLTNFHYGQKEERHSKHKIVEFKGFGNGFSNVLYFECRQGIWRLMKFEDLSD